MVIKARGVDRETLAYRLITFIRDEALRRRYRDVLHRSTVEFSILIGQKVWMDGIKKKKLHLGVNL